MARKSSEKVWETRLVGDTDVDVLVFWQLECRISLLNRRFEDRHFALAFPGIGGNFNTSLKWFGSLEYGLSSRKARKAITQIVNSHQFVDNQAVIDALMAAVHLLTNLNNKYLPTSVDMWYNRHERSWVVQLLDGEGSQIGNSYYVYQKAQALNIVAELKAQYHL